MLSLFVGGALGLAVQPQQAGSMQASPDPAASPSPAAQVQGVGFDWASGAKLPEGATAVPLAAPAAVPATAAAPVAEAPPPTAVAQVPEFVQPEAPVAPTAVAVAPTAADGTQQPVATASCVSLQPGTSDYWCSTTCATSVCPETMCKCGDGAQQQAAAKVDAAIEKHQENEQKVKDAAQAIASSPLPVAPAAAAAPVVDADHADAEQKVKDAMGAKSKEDAVPLSQPFLTSSCFPPLPSPISLTPASTTVEQSTSNFPSAKVAILPPDNVQCKMVISDRPEG